MRKVLLYSICLALWMPTSKLDAQVIVGMQTNRDTLFVGAVGRADLPGGSAQTLLRSIREKIYTLPGNTIVWPGHDYGMDPSTTVAREREKNSFTI